MAVPMAGIVTIVLALLASRKLGWNADPARIPLLIATVLFAFAILFPTLAVTERDEAWLITAHVSLALGAIVLVVAAFQFTREGIASPAKPDAARGKRKRKPKKTATAPTPAAPDDPDDPHAGPHADPA